MREESVSSYRSKCWLTNVRGFEILMRMRALHLLIDVTVFTGTHRSNTACVCLYMRVYFLVASAIQSHALFPALDTPVTLVHLARVACQ